MIYFNYQCYSASFLSRVRLAALPKSIGPGPVQLVMKEVNDGDISKMLLHVDLDFDQGCQMNYIPVS